MMTETDEETPFDAPAPQPVQASMTNTLPVPVTKNWNVSSMQLRKMTCRFEKADSEEVMQMAKGRLVSTSF